MTPTRWTVSQKVAQRRDEKPLTNKTAALPSTKYAVMAKSKKADAIKHDDTMEIAAANACNDRCTCACACVCVSYI